MAQSTSTSSTFVVKSHLDNNDIVENIFDVADNWTAADIVVHLQQYHGRENGLLFVDGILVRQNRILTKSEISYDFIKSIPRGMYIYLFLSVH